MTDAAIAVRMDGITKLYPRVVANKNASLSVLRGEVHAVVGENGAGKSTLMKILYGLASPDEGTIEVQGHALHHHAPADAIRAGLGMVFQHFVLVGPLTVAENVVLGAEPRRGPLFDRARAQREVREISERFGLPIDPRAKVEDLPVGMQQRVEILKVLFRRAEVLILDEPTAVLTPQETDELVLVMRGLAGQGKSILFISHKLREVMVASDRVTVMRQGRTVRTLETSGTSPGEIAHLMMDRDLAPPVRPAAREPGEAVLEIGNLSALSDRGTAALSGIDLVVRAGEIVGVAGVEGNGQTELVECVAGLRAVSEGTVRIGSRENRQDPAACYAAGLAHIPEDRHERGVILDFSVEDNSILGLQGRFSGRLGLRHREIHRHAEGIIESCDVRPRDPAIRLSQLSGGNQQKVVVGRELARRPRLLVAAHPTRGLDVGASEFVLRRVLVERDRGAGVLFVSAELPELLAISDRIVVLARGRIAGEVDPAEVDEARLGLLMAGHG
ncbi:MAG: ABC transporter ATP-binding protein [Planctomycetes bacterium]|nr:ABC transporter ATP-binding protein [Planctomycetota bacterium]